MPITEYNSHPKVLHIASGDLWAGAEVQLFTLVKSLQNYHNIPVSVVLLNHGMLENKLLENKINVIVLDESRLSGLQILIKLIQVLQEQRPDVVHTHRIKENILGSVAAFFFNDMISMRTAHGAPEHYAKWWQLPKRLIKLLDLFAGRYLQKRIFAVSDDLAKILVSSYGIKKITVIENGVDIDEIRSHKINHVQYPDNRTSKYKVGLAGRLTTVKRVDIFIKTADYLKKSHPEIDTTFHIYGDGPLRDELEALSTRLNTIGTVYFEGHCANIHQKLQDLDVLLITSDHEGLPMILLESMTLQIPVIAHSVGGIPKVLDYGSCGILVEDNNASSYGNAIYQLASSPRRQEILLTNALDRVTRYYSAEQNARRYVSAYMDKL